MRELVLAKGPPTRRLILVGAVALSPLVTTGTLMIDPFATPKFALLLSAVMLTAAVRGAEFAAGRRLHGFGRLAVPIGAVAGSLAVGWLAGPYKDWSLVGEYSRSNGLLPAILFVLFGALLVDSFAGHTGKLGAALTASATLVGLYALIQVAGFDPFPLPQGSEPDITISTIGNSNFVGGFLAIALPVAIGLVAGSLDRRLVPAIAVIAAGVLATGSVGAVVAAVGGTAVTCGILATRRWRQAGALGAAVGLALGAGLVTLVVSSRVSVAIPTTTIRSIAARAEYWQAAANMASRSPFLGRGPNVYALEGVSFRTEVNARTEAFRFATEPHSVFFYYLTSAGIVGAAGFTLLLLWTVKRSVRVATAPRPDPLGAGFAGAACAYFLQSLVSIDEFTIRVALWTTLAALALSTSRVGDPSFSTPATSRRPVAFGLGACVAVAAAAASVLFPYRLLVTEVRAKHAVDLFADGRVEQAVAEFDRAVATSGHYWYRMTYAIQLGRAALARPQDGDRLIAAMSEQFSYVDELPDLDSLRAYGRLLYLWSRFEPEAAVAAGDLYGRALGLDPRNPLLGVEASDVLIELDRAAEAVGLLVSYAPISPGYPRYWGALAQAHAQLGNLAVASDLAEHALTLNPRDERALAALELVEAGPS